MRRRNRRECRRAFASIELNRNLLQPEKRKDRLLDLVTRKEFRQAHPRSEHFIPLYIAAGAGESGQVQILNAQYAAPTFAFGI